MKLAEIITIGDELLIGQVIDTNSAWLGAQLSDLGIRVKQITSVSDDAIHIKETLEAAQNRADFIIITGGLGPTKDDITKKTLAEYFNCGMVMHLPTLQRVEDIFSMRKMPMLETNKQQALVPEICTVLANPKGTAPGMLFNHHGKVFISLPGVPYEMKAIFSDSVIPYLKSSGELPVIIHETLLTAGIGESFLAEKIKDIEQDLPPHIKLAYLPAPAQVRLRLTGHGTDYNILSNEVSMHAQSLQSRLGDYIFGRGEETLEMVVGNLLQSEGLTLGMAESCSGGFASHLITSVPGSSKYFKGTLVAYAYEIKESVLGVSPETIISKGAVSEECIIQMATNARTLFKADYAIATSGVAGPTGGTPDKPVGSVWIAVAGPHGCESKLYLLGDERIRIIERTGIMALDMLRKQILKRKKS